MWTVPFNLPRRSVEQPFFNREQKALLQKRLDSADRRGIQLIDHLIALPYTLQSGETFQSLKASVIREITNLPLGITQLAFHLAIRKGTGSMPEFHREKREMEYRLFLDPELRDTLRLENIRLISWKELRDRQRALQ